MKKIWQFLKNRLVFHIMDVVGFAAAFVLIMTTPDTQALFYMLGDPTVYLTLLLVTFLGRSLYWLVILRGEMFYLKNSVFGFIADYIRVVLVTLCCVGAYLFIFAVL